MFFQIVGISTAVFASVMSSSMLAIAFPDMALDFGMSFTSLLWRTVLFFSVFAGCIPFFGKLADRINPKKQLMLGLLLFIVASLGSFGFALARIWPGFLLFQVLTALADAIMVPAQVCLIQKTVEKSRIGWALGIFSSVISIATLVAPALGGLLVEYYGWSSILLVLSLFAGVALLMIAALVPNSAAQAKGVRGWKYQRTLYSTLLLVALVAFLQLPFCAELASMFRMLGAILSLSCGVLLFWNEKTTSSSERLFLGEMFTNPEFLRACIRVFLLYVVVNGIAIFVPSYLREVHQIPALILGWIILVESVVLISLGGASGLLADRNAQLSLSLGILISIVALSVLAWAPVGVSWIVFFVVYALIGLGGSLSAPAQNKIAMSSAPSSEVGNYMGVFQFLQFVSGAFSAGSLGSLYNPGTFKYLVVCLILLQLAALALVVVKGKKKWVLP